MTRFVPFLLALCTPVILSGQSEWRYIGPVESEVRCMAVDADLLLSSMSNGGRLFRSTNAGKTWGIIDTTLFPKGVQNIGIIPHDSPIVVATISPNDGRFLLSTDMGVTWDQNGVMPLAPMNRFYVKAAAPDLIFAVCGYRRERLFRSTDYGRTWTEPYIFPASSDGASIAVGVSHTTPDVYANVDTDIGGQYFFHSPDDGITWEYIGPGARYVSTVLVEPDRAKTVYAATTDRIIVSIDGGTSWRTFYQGIANNYVLSILQDEVQPDLMFLLTEAGTALTGVSFSRTHGQSWMHDTTSAFLSYKYASSPFDPLLWLQYDHARDRLYLQTKTGIFIREHLITKMDRLSIPSATSLRIYPQPAHEYLYLGVTSSTKTPAVLRVYNLYGILTYERYYKSSTNLQWDLRDNTGKKLPSGIYLLTLHEGLDVSIHRVLIQR